MGVIRPARVGAAPPAGALRLDDFERRGVLLREAAEREAQRVLAGARTEHDRLLREGRELGAAQGRADGHAKGLAEGRERGRAEALAEWREKLGEVERAWTVALASFEAQREELLRGAKEDLLALAVAIARRATHGVIDAAPERVARATLEGVLREWTGRSRLRVLAHPSDAAGLREVLEGAAERLATSEHAELVEDDAVERGACVVRTSGGGELDASASVRVERIVAELTGGVEA